MNEYADPESIVDTILYELNATPEWHAENSEAEWLECQGLGERAAWRLASAHETDPSSFVLDVLAPYFYANDPDFRARVDAITAS